MNLEAFKNMSEQEAARALKSVFIKAIDGLDDNVLIEHVVCLHDPAATTLLESDVAVHVTFIQRALKKYFRMSFRLHDLEAMDLDTLKQIIKDQYEGWLCQQGPTVSIGQIDNNMSLYYNIFRNGGGDEYDKNVRAFFKACQISDEFKGKMILPIALETSGLDRSCRLMGINNPRCEILGMDTPLMPEPVLYFKCRLVYRDDVEFIFGFYGSALDTKLDKNDSDDLKQLYEMAGAEVYAGTKVLRLMRQMLRAYHLDK